MNQIISHNKCAYNTDYFNNVGIGCECSKIKLELFFLNGWHTILVCRNYWAELFKRHRDDLKNIYSCSLDFKASCRAKVEIIEDISGCVLYQNLISVGFMKIRNGSHFKTNANGLDMGDIYTHIESSYISKHIIKNNKYVSRHFYMPRLYRLIDYQTYIIYDIEDIFNRICNDGIEDAIERFGSIDEVNSIIRSTIKKITEILESEGITYKKKCIAPLLKKKISYKDMLYEEKIIQYELDVIRAIAELLNSMSLNKLK